MPTTGGARFGRPTLGLLLLLLAFAGITCLLLVTDHATRSLSQPSLGKRPPPWLPGYDIFPSSAFVSVDSLPVSQCYKPKPHAAFYALDNGHVPTYAVSGLLCRPAAQDRGDVSAALHANFTLSMRCPLGFSRRYGRVMRAVDGGAKGELALTDSHAMPSTGVSPPLLHTPIDAEEAQAAFGTEGLGLAWAYAQCEPPAGSDLPRITRLRLRPYALPALQRRNQPRPASADAVNVLVVLLESTSTELYRHIMPRTRAFMKSRPPGSVFRFRHTSVFGVNTIPNVAEMWGRFPVLRSGQRRLQDERDPLNLPSEIRTWWPVVERAALAVGLEVSKAPLKAVANQRWTRAGRNIFQAFRDAGFVPAAADDYCPENGTGQSFPFIAHRMTGNLVCDFGTDLNHFQQPSRARLGIQGCVHGEHWVERHAEFIRGMWDAYPHTPKFHVAHMNGGHSDNWASLAEHDQGVATLLGHLRDSGALEDTVVVLAGDHGFHSYTQFNDMVAGEFEHRSPVLEMLLPPKLLRSHPQMAAVLGANQHRRVTHRDLHRTLLRLASLGLSGGTRGGGGGSSGGGGGGRSRGEPRDAKASDGLARDAMVRDRAARGSFDLLTETVPAGRTCADAQIPRQWCNCFVWRGSNSSEVDERGLDIHKLAGSTSTMPTPAGLIAAAFLLGCVLGGGCCQRGVRTAGKRICARRGQGQAPASRVSRTC